MIRPRLNSKERRDLGVPSAAMVRDASRVLRQLETCKERGGTLRQQYHDIAALLDAEADYIGQVTSDRERPSYMDER